MTKCIAIISPYPDSETLCIVAINFVKCKQCMSL